MIIHYELAGHAVFRVYYKNNIVGCTYRVTDDNKDAYWVAHRHTVNPQRTVFKGKNRHEAAKRFIMHEMMKTPSKIIL